MRGKLCRLDTDGLVLKAVVHPGNLRDRLGAKVASGALGTGFPRLRHVWADRGYARVPASWPHGLVAILADGPTL